MSAAAGTREARPLSEVPVERWPTADRLPRGERPPWDRALIAAGVCLLGALLLPVGQEGRRLVFLSELILEPRGAWVGAAHLAAGLGLCTAGTLLGAERAKLLLSSGPVLCLLAALASHPETGLLPFLPHPFARGAGFFVGAVSLAAAAAWHRRGAGELSAARALAMGSALCAVLLFVWPHPGGGLGDLVRSSLRLLPEAPSSARGALVHRALAGTLPAWLALAAAATAISRRVAPVPPSWLLPLPPALVLLLGIKAGLERGQGALALVGLRAALILFAVLVATSAALALAGAARPWRPALAAPLAAMALVLAFRPGLRAEGPWPLAPAPAWAERLFGEALPALVEAAAEAKGPADLERRARASLGPALSEPGLGPALAELTRLLGQRRPARRALVRAVDALNEASRALALPFFVDARLAVHTQADGRRRRVVAISSYRIRHAEQLEHQHQHLTALWLEDLTARRPEVAERADAAPGEHARAAAGDNRLGWRRVGEGRALILLDAVRTHAGRLGEELGVEVDEQSLARAVQAHELQHVVDGDRLRPPFELERRLLGASEAHLVSAAGELSAYLAELAQNREPITTVSDCARLAGAEEPGVDGVACALALEAVGVEGPADLQRTDAPTVRARARAAHRRWFGGPLAGEPPWVERARADR